MFAYVSDVVAGTLDRFTEDLTQVTVHLSDLKSDKTGAI